MKFKYKLLIVSLSLIIIASLPIVLFILQKTVEEKLSSITNQSLSNSQIISRSGLNLFLMNGGDIKATRVDAEEMIAILKPLSSIGLIYADAILLSKKEQYNGIILAKFAENDTSAAYSHADGKLTTDEILDILSNRKKEFFSDKLNANVYEFSHISSMPNKTVSCVGRLVFSKEVALSPIMKLKKIVMVSFFVSLIVAASIGVLLSRQISKPIEYLIDEVEIIGSGDFSHQIAIKTKDEVGKLTNTFNHLTRVLNLEINHLKQKNIELINLDKLKDEFLANITHELKTPLFGIMGLAEALAAGIGGDLNGQAINNLSLIISSSKRLSNLVNDILDYSKLKYGDIALDKKPVNLYSHVSLIISLTTPLILKKDVKIINTVNKNLFVEADENRLQQILFNLLGNAVKFTSSGEININSELTDDGNIKISVSDTGIGIAPENIERIFNSFEQVDGSITRKYGGTGLGLSISKHLIDLHGGKIWAVSEENKGSTFSFTLKKAEAPLVLNTFKIDQIPYAGTNIAFDADNETMIEPYLQSEENQSRIMVVDDEPVNCRIIINHLSLKGFHVFAVNDGPLALKRIDSGDIPDLIILDIMLPQMSGFDVCKKIREKYSSAELPILMLTAKQDPDDLQIGFEAGTNDYITKPVSREELLARVNSLVSLKKSVKAHNELELIRREITIAHNIQKSLLNNKFPEYKGVSFALRYFPMFELGGDYYEIAEIDKNKFSVFIADVSGHGIPAAFISAMLKVICALFNTVVTDPSEFLDQVNQIIYNLVEEQFITACFAIIDLENKKIQYANAGHWPLLIYKKDSGDIVFDKSNGLPIGCYADEKYQTREFEINCGDRIVLFTDGIVELRNSENKMFSMEKLNELIKKHSDKNAEELADTAIAELKKWYNTTGNNFSDDITLIIVDINDSLS